MLRKIVENIVDKKLLIEISVKDAFNRFYAKYMSPQDYQNAIKIIQPDNNILLPETKWVLQCLQRDMNGNSGYLTQLRRKNKIGILDLWERLKMKKMIQGQEANINRFKSIPELKEYILNNFDIDDILRRTSGEWSKAVNDAKNNIRKVYEDEMWFVIVPLSTEASCYWGNGTHWCTATRNEDENMFHNYFDDEDIFILINKQNKEKYQFHFVSDQFMDKNNSPIEGPIFKTIGANNGLISYFQRYCENEGYMDEFIDMIYNIIGMEQRGLTPIKLEENDYNLIDENNQIAFPNMVFTTPVHFPYEWTPVNVIIDGVEHHNVMNTSGDFLLPSSYKIVEVGTYSNNFVYIRSEELGVNYVDLKKGKLISEEWFADGYDFTSKHSHKCSCAIVENEKGQQNILKSDDGKLLSDEWFDSIKPLSGEHVNFFQVTKEGDDGWSLYNILNFDGELVLPKWYNKISDAGALSGEIMICKHGDLFDLIDIRDKRVLGSDFEKINTLIITRNLIYPFFEVKKQGKYNLLTIYNGYILSEWADSVKYDYWKIDNSFFIKVEYNGKLYAPVQLEYDDKLKLEPWDKPKKTNENKMKESDILYVIQETIKRLK